MSKEAQFQSKIIKRIRDCNGIVFNFVGNKYQMPGIPDTFVCHRYWRGFIEFKGETTKLEKHQEVIIRKLKERGTPAFVVREPNRIENEKGDLLATFDGVLQMLKILEQL